MEKHRFPPISSRSDGLRERQNLLTAGKNSPVFIRKVELSSQNFTVHVLHIRSSNRFINRMEYSLYCMLKHFEGFSIW